MKVLYITVPSFFDLDVSLIRELSSFIDIHVLLITSPQSKKSSAFSIEKLSPICGVFSAKEYEGMKKYKDVIDFSRWSIANNTDNSIHSCINLSRKIKKYVKKNNFDLIHMTTACKTALFMIPFISRFPHTLLTVHDPIAHEKLSWIENIVRRKIFYWANKNILLLSKSLLKPFVKEYNIKEDRVYFSSLSVYDILTRFESRKNIYGDYILFFGRIERYKGVELLINAYKKTNLSTKGIKLVIAGKGNISRSEAELTDDIIFINRFIENDELANLIQHCKYVVLPYLSATQSGCVMSAFAFNKPVLATNVGDFPFTIQNGKNGMICNANDLDSLRDAMDQMEMIDCLVLEQNIKEMYQQNGSRSWNCIAKSMVDTYKSIVCR